MKNIEMEIVAFDAEDVIATSGPVPTGDKMMTQVKWVIAYNQTVGDAQKLRGSNGGLFESLVDKKPDHYIWYGAGIWDSASGGGAGLFNADGGRQATKYDDDVYTEAYSVQAIADWVATWSNPKN